MTNYWPGVQHVFVLRAATDVVDDIAAVRRDDADVIQAAGKSPRDDVARLPIRVRLLAATFEERHQIRHAAVIDVRVGPGESPHARIHTEVRAHVVLQLFLPIDVRRGAECANDYTGVSAAV